MMAEDTKFNDQLRELGKIGAQYLAIKGISHATGGGLAGLLMSNAATKGIERVFSAPAKAQKTPADDGKSAPQTAEQIGQQIGNAAAGAIDRVLREKLAFLKPFTQPAAPTGPKSSDLPPERLNIDEIFRRATRGADSPQEPSQETKRTVQEVRETVRKLTPDQRAQLPADRPEGYRFTQPRPAAGGAAGVPRVPGGTGAAGAGESAGAGEASGAAGGAGAAGPVAAPAAALVVWLLMVNAMREAGMKWAKEQEEYARRIGEVNPIIASQNAELDMNRILRDIQSGNNMAESNQKLYDELNALEEAVRPIKDAVTEIKNFVATDAVQFTRQTLEGFKNIYEVNRQLYEGFREAVTKLTRGVVVLPELKDINADKTPAGAGFGDFLMRVNDEIQQQKQDENERLNRIRDARRGAFRNDGVGGGW